MAVSIASNQNHDDDNTGIVSSTNDNQQANPGFLGNSIDEGTQNTENSPESNIAVSENLSVSQETVSSADQADNDWLNALHPEQTPSIVNEGIEKKNEPMIPNLYIKADAEKSNIVVPEEDTDLFSVSKPSEDAKESGGFDMDDILDDETVSNKNTQSPTVENISAEPPVEKAVVNKNNVDPFMQKPQEKNIVMKTAKITHKITAKKGFLKGVTMIVAGLFGILVLGFLIKTMFPLGLGGETTSLSTDVVLTGTIAMEDTGAMLGSGTEHGSADSSTGDLRQKLEEYSTQGEDYYQKGIAFKSRDMVRYALYVEKKSQDLIDMLDLNPNIDTKDIVVYFAQFDDYLQTLSQRENDLILNPPVVEETVVEEPVTEGTGIGSDTGIQQQPELSQFPNG